MHFLERGRAGHPPRCAGARDRRCGSARSTSHRIATVCRKTADYPYAFGGDGTGTGVDLAEPHAFLDRCAALGVRLVCVTAGSPYYCPHAQRPAYFPPSDGYDPPYDPLHRRRADDRRDR